MVFIGAKYGPFENLILIIEEGAPNGLEVVEWM
jgi:hypothetical protein